jgi:hypothetical protein
MFSPLPVKDRKRRPPADEGFEFLGENRLSFSCPQSFCRTPLPPWVTHLLWSPVLLIAAIGYRSLVETSPTLFWLTYAVPSGRRAIPKQLQQAAGMPGDN